MYYCDGGGDDATRELKPKTVVFPNPNAEQGRPRPEAPRLEITR